MSERGSSESTQWALLIPALMLVVLGTIQAGVWLHGRNVAAQAASAAAEHLAPGGLLAYVTCSPHRAETRVVLDGLLKRHPELREIDTKKVLSGVARGQLDLAGGGLSAQLWPHRDGTDAMFIALVERIN